MAKKDNTALPEEELTDAVADEEFEEFDEIDTDEKPVGGKETSKKKSGKAKKPAGKPVKKAKGNRITKYFRDLKGEFNKIIWPTFPVVVRNTTVTLVLCVVLGVIIAAIDAGLGWLVDMLLSIS